MYNNLILKLNYMINYNKKLNEKFKNIEPFKLLNKISNNSI